MENYKIVSDTVVQRLSDGVFIPIGVGSNGDSRRYAEWLALGNTPEPA